MQDGGASLTPRLLWLTVLPRFEMQRCDKTHGNSYDLTNCFGFNESDADLSLWEKSAVMNQKNAVLEFQANKPYRLALYVRPSEQKRLQRTRMANLVTNNTEKQNRGKKNESLNSTRQIGKRTAKTTKTANKKANVMLFDENVKPESVSKRLKLTPEKAKEEKNVKVEVASVRKNVLKEVNTKPVTKTKRYKTRRSYERKLKEKDESENIPEPPSEEIIKELEFKKLSRTKQKRIAKEDQEFEKWAKNINSDFNDVDQFELSIAYD